MADQKIADRALLKLADLPAGWEAKDDDDDESDVSNCEGLKRMRAIRTGNATAPTFANGNNTQLNHAVGLFPDVENATKVVDGVTSEVTRRCLAKELAQTIGSSNDDDYTIEDTRTSELNVEPVGTRSRAFRITIDFAASGIDVSAFIDVLVFHEDRAVAILLLLDVLTPFDQDLSASLAKRADTLLREAIAA